MVLMRFPFLAFGGLEQRLDVASEMIDEYVRIMSALPPKADVAERKEYVRFGANNGLMHCNKATVHSITWSTRAR